MKRRRDAGGACLTRRRPRQDAAPAAARRPGWILFALATGGFAIGTTEFAAMSLLPFFSRDLNIGTAHGGDAISLYALGVVTGAPLVGVLFVRMPRRSLLVALMLAFALGNALTALATSYAGLLAARFASGLPHGAYFGVASLLATSLAPPDKRAQAVARVMLGLTVATVIGVPIANALGQWLGWRWGFGLVAAMALTAAVLIRLVAPLAPAAPAAGPMRELGALRRPQVWLTLATGAVGFGGIFAVYTYLASTILEVTTAGPGAIPPMLAVFGLGLTTGNLVCAWAADRGVMRAIGGTLIFSATVLAIYPAGTRSLWTMMPIVFLVGCGGGLGAAIQTRLMDVAGDAQMLAAGLNQSAFNMANALGAWLAGLALSGGLGLAFSGWVGAAMALGGLLVWTISLAIDRVG